MSVVGFDIGNENCVIAAVKQGGVDVLLNEESNRETPAIVCFGEKQRFLGSSGAASAMMNPKSTISQIKRLIGRRFKEPGVEKELKVLPFQSCESPDGGIWINVKYLGETHTFTPVQILGMLFAHLKDIAEKSLETPVADCVIGVPSYFTDLQRREYLNAASIAGLKPLRLIHDCTATALGYGIYKTGFSNSGTTNVVFVDIGHCDTQVSIVAFQAGHMRVLSHAFDSNLGGRDFDELLFGYFAGEFKEKYNINVYSNVKACIRLRAACEKLKKVLSANAEAPLNIECLMDEKDVRSSIKREEFEKLASGLLEIISVPCKKALADAGLNLDEVHSVEIVGSGSRIPAITRLLTSIFSREPRRTMNASECVARGCALQCAMLSPVFRVKEYEVQDSIPFSIGISSDEGPICLGSKANGLLFPKGQPIPSVKLLTFQRNGMIHLEAFYVNTDELPSGVSSKISRFTIGPFQGSHSDKVRVKVKVKLNLHGIVTVESASLIEGHADDSVTEPSKMGKMESATVENVHRHSSADGVMKDKSSRRLQMSVSENIYGGMTVAELTEAQEKEHQFAQHDRTVEQIKDKKNTLESYVYEMRSKLFNTYRSFATDSEREGISKNLQQTEEWLYEDGDDETENAYTSKLQDLKKLVDPIENRYKDGEARAQATRELLKCIVEFQTAVESLSAQEKEPVINECFKAEKWLREKTQLQDSLPKNTDPVLWSTDIKNRTEELKLKCKQAWRKTHPKR
ncbi:heat shock 70 kDa protein 16-like [Pistacia vera]|uniref:heat shock 70 kDa protein 16-like n=1 Tax=Pistacia vera TaxID=55513 RepID=UPI001262C99F|nr:heat shock 70 kDa protein 16-like [Pistacia vera]